MIMDSTIASMILRLSSRERSGHLSVEVFRIFDELVARQKADSSRHRVQLGVCGSWFADLILCLDSRWFVSLTESFRRNFTLDIQIVDLIHLASSAFVILSS